jgi:hypothetical protein
MECFKNGKKNLGEMKRKKERKEEKAIGGEPSFLPCRKREISQKSLT